MKKGFSLIESVLYLAMLPTVVVILSLFVGSLRDSTLKQRVIDETEQQADQAVWQISQLIRNSDAINSPSQGQTAASLSLASFEASQNPTLIDLAAGAIRLKKGAEEAVALTSPLTTASNLSVINLSSNNTPGLIQLSFNLSYNTNNSSSTYQFSRPVSLTASLR